MYLVFKIFITLIFLIFEAFKKAIGCFCFYNLLGTIVLSNSLGGLRNGVLGKLSWEDKTDGSLDFFGGDGGSLVVGGETAGFRSGTLEDVVNERVHDGHGTLGDVDFWVTLSEDLENV